MFFIYNIAWILSYPILWFISIWNTKIRKILIGQRNAFNLLKLLPAKTGKRVWIHAASLGEFEMAVPLIVALKDKGIHDIHVSFFSPSGYEHAKLNDSAKRYYLPFDTSWNSKKWLRLLNPDMVIFVKYEFWPNYLGESFKNNIDIYFWNLILRENHFIFKPYGRFWLNALTKSNMLFVQNEQTIQLLENVGIDQTHFMGDIRYERMHLLKQKSAGIPEIFEGYKEYKTLILGSSWPDEEFGLELFLRKFDNNWKIIIAPHDIGKHRMRTLKLQFPTAEFLSTWDGIIIPSILIIDQIGLLSRLYQLANLAVIGGAFGKGLHNIIEPCSWGVPVIFGPNTTKFPEAIEFIDSGVGFQAKTVVDLAETIHKNQELVTTENLHEKTLAYFSERITNTEKLVDFMLKNDKLTPTNSN